MTLEQDYSYVHIISGEDFPAQSVEDIYEYFDSTDKIYCECTPAIRGKSLRYRFYRFYWLYTKFHMNYKKRIVRYINLAFVGIQICLPFLKKRKLGEFSEIYGGLIWGSYPRELVEYIMDYIKRNDRLLKQLEWCKIPEELCFPTIIMNSKYKVLVSKKVYRYENWQRGDGSGPAYLDMSDLNEIEQSGAFFIRKVRKNSDLVDVLMKKQKRKLEASKNE